MPIQSSPSPDRAGSPPPAPKNHEAEKPDTMALIGSRLQDLRTEQATGLDRLARLQGEAAQIQRETSELQATLLRINGAITVLEELSGETGDRP